MKRKDSSRPSEKEPVIAREITKRLHISEDVLGKAPVLLGYGSHRVCIENYRSIIEYTEEKIRIQTKTGRLNLLGEHLVIAYYREDGMCVMGNIYSIEFVD